MLNIGWAVSDMTPSRPAMVQGQKHRRIASEAIDPLLVTALALDDGTPAHAAVFVSLDIPMIPRWMTAELRERVAAALPELPGAALIVHGTHTHTSMVVEDIYYEYPGGDVMTPRECADLVLAKAVEAVVGAWRDRRPRAVGRAWGHAVVGHNRHAVYRDGHAAMYGQTNRPDFWHIGGYEDHSLDLFFTWNPDGSLAGIAITIPCPSQVTEGLSVWSADFWHEVRVELRRRLGDGLYVLPMCGAGGDQSPHFLLYGRQEQEMRERRGVTERQEIALRVADGVERALACTPPGDMAERLDHEVRDLRLTPRQVSREERDWAAAEHARVLADPKEDPTSWWPEGLKRVVETYDGEYHPEPVPAEVHVVRLGDAVIATNPFELFLDWGLLIKARSNAAQTVVMQLAGQGFYLPTERAVAGGGYGAMPAVSAAGPEAGHELVEATLDMIAGVLAD